MKQDYYLWLWFRIGGVDYKRRFNAIWQRMTPNREGFETPGKRAGLHSFITGIRGEYLIEISADELYDTTAQKFVANFYLCNEQYISFDEDEFDPEGTPPADTTFIQITTGNGPLPESLVEENPNFPEVSFTVKEVRGRTWDALTESYPPVYKS